MVQEHTIWLEDWRVLLCAYCQLALRPGKGTVAHFRNEHKLTGERLNAIIALVRRLPIVDPHDMQLPADSTEPLEPLLPPVAGYSCTQCRFLTTNQKSMITHQGRAQHGRAGDGRGYEATRLQSFSGGRYARYWIVSSGSDAEPEELTTVTTISGQALTLRLSSWKEKKAVEEAQKRQVIDSSTGVDVETPWVREMGWAVHLGGKDMTRLHKAAARPAVGKDTTKPRQQPQRQQDEAAQRVERRLELLCRSFDRLVARCIERLPNVPKETLRWLKSADPNKPHVKPFRLPQKGETVERYTGVWKQYLCYCVRAYWLGFEGAKDELGIQFDQVQQSALEAVAEMIDMIDTVANPNGGRRPGPGPNSTDGPEDKLDDHVFTFCVASLEQQIAVNVFHNPLIHFTAVLGIDDERKGWKPAQLYTGFLAALIWCSRLLLLEYVFTAEEFDDRDLDEMGPETVEYFKQYFRTWMADGTHTPISTIISRLAIGKGFRTKEGGAARIAWEDGQVALHYMGRRIVVDEFRAAARAAITEAGEELDGLLFGGWARAAASIDLTKIADSFIYQGADRSFATNEDNAWLRPGPDMVAGLAEAALWDDEAAGGDGRWKLPAVQRWLQQLKSFRLSLLAATHIWAGQPGRGPEIMTIKHCDTQQLLRNVIIFDGQVVLITDRDKAKAIRDIGRKIARFLPEDLGKMMVALIAWLMPFEKMVCEDAGAPGPDSKLDAWLWKDAKKGRWDTEQLTSKVTRLTAGHIGVRLTVADYRHIAIELGRTIHGIVVQRHAIDVCEGSDSEDSEDEATGEARSAGRSDLIWDLQATHGSRIARQHYAVNVQFPGQLQPQMVASYREISRLWHRYLSFDSAAAGHKRAAPMGEDGDGNDGNRTTVRRRTTVHERAPVNVEELGHRLDNGLRLMLGGDAIWKSPQQRAGMVRIMSLRHGEVLIIVLPTGGGKSFFFMLPAVRGVNGGVTIVVVPFVALIDDLVRRAHDFGIDCLHWKAAAATGREGMAVQARPASLVVVSADVATGPEFATYISSLNRDRLLRRIFVDECHTIIMDVNYRKRLANLKELYHHGCPVILLTATLPVTLERWFRGAMLAHDAEIVRASTVKRNIRYEVVELAPPTRRGWAARLAAIADEVEQRVQAATAHMTGDQKGVVYCPSKADCEGLAEMLGCTYYHADVDERANTLAAWSEGRSPSRWIVATTALGTGVDIKGIVEVIHAGLPYGLVDFVQQTGRGGRRDSEIVQSTIVLVEGDRPYQKLHDSDVEQANRAAITEFTTTTGCRRLVLSRFMDGIEEASSCTELGAGTEACDRCEATAALEAAETTAPNRAREATKADEAGLRQIRQRLSEMEGKCPNCYIEWSAGLSAEQETEEPQRLQHTLAHCRNSEDSEYYQRWRSRLNFPDFACCWACGLPQEICPVAVVEETGETKVTRERRSTANCQWGDCMLFTIATVPCWSQLAERVKEEFGIDTTNEGEYINWLCRRRTVYGLEAINAFGLFAFIISKSNE